MPESLKAQSAAQAPESKSDGSYDKANSKAEELLTAARAGTREGIQQYADYNKLFGLNEDQGADWILQQILMRMRYDIDIGEGEGDEFKLSVKFTNVDMTVVLPLYYAQAMQLEYDNAMKDNPLSVQQLETEYQKIFADLMVKNSETKTEKTADIKLERADGEWKIIPDEKLGNAMLGGYLDVQKSMRQNPPQVSQAPEIEASSDEYGEEEYIYDMDDDDEYVYDEEGGSMVKPRE